MFRLNEYDVHLEQELPTAIAMNASHTYMRKGKVKLSLYLTN
jgi:hypothetical protein